MEVIDGIVPEPAGGAHTDPQAACEKVGEILDRALDELTGLAGEQLVKERYRKFRVLGAFARK